MELTRGRPALARARTIGVMLGSFDPPHRGHQWVTERLLACSDAVLLLVPDTHFHKTIQPGRNATLQQRLAMLARLYGPRHPSAGRVALGLAHEVLFVRLWRCLGQMFPAASITFGMGTDTHARLQRSGHYFKRQGLPWTPADEQALLQLRSRVLVLYRKGDGHGPGQVTSPHAFFGLCSTRVRETVEQLRVEQAPAESWAAALDRMVAPEVLAFIRQEGLYQGSTEV